MSEPSSPDGAPAPRLVVRTVRVDDPGPLLALLPEGPDTTAWVRRGDGLVGWGVAAVCRTAGADRFTEAGEWWTDRVRSAVVRDEVRGPGTGLVCFGSFAFADEPGDSVLVVPEVVVGRRGDSTWLTTTDVGAFGSSRALGPALPPATAPPDLHAVSGSDPGLTVRPARAAAVEGVPGESYPGRDARP